MVKRFEIVLTVEVLTSTGYHLDKEFYYTYAHNVEEVMEQYKIGERSLRYGLIKDVKVYES